MSVERLQAALQRALARPTITPGDVEAFRRAVKDEGGITADELSALQRLAEQHRDRFEPAATRRLHTLLAKLTAPRPALPSPPATPAVPDVVSWDSFTPAASAAALTGPERDEGLETFARLAPAVAAGALSEADQLLLSSAAARIGVMGEAQALRAVTLLQQLPAADVAAFHALTQQASSPLARAFLYKALAAGTPLAALRTFEAAIHGWDNARLLSTLNLADPITDDGAQSGVKQQFHSSCVPTTGQALRGEVDPVYALEVRTQNTDVHDAVETDGSVMNPKLAQEQEAVLTAAGGWASPRTFGGGGVAWDTIDSVYNQRAAQTGFVYSVVQLDQRPDLTLAAALDLLAGQLSQGIPTPVLVGVPGAEKCHAMIALEVQGTGPQQRFLLHDPWKGDTMWVTRTEFLEQRAPMGDFSVLGGLHLASPAPAVPASPVTVPVGP